MSLAQQTRIHVNKASAQLCQRRQEGEMKPRHSAPCVSSLPSNQLFHPFPAIPYWEGVSS